MDAAFAVVGSLVLIAIIASACYGLAESHRQWKADNERRYAAWLKTHPKERE